ncbi:MAG: GH25 family lysozyme [Tepidisphaeraceae bacterium]
MTQQHDQRQAESVTHVVDFEPLESRLFMRVEGVDVSVFQGAINWQTLRSNNKEFAFVRSSRTTLALDPNFHTNMANAKAAGVITGPYHRALPLGDGDAGVYTDPVTDANRFYNAAKDYIKEGYLRPVLDAEDGATLGKATLSQWWTDFIGEFKRLSGVEPIIYANTNYATNLVDASLAAEHDLWIARWNGGNANLVNPQTDQPETPGGFANPYGVWNVPIGGAASHSSWDFWQYTSNGDGIALGVSSARLDLDVFNGDLEQMKRGFVIGHQWNFNATGNPFAVGATPITIQAEDYDNGKQGYAFNDTTPLVNTGGGYRSGEHGGFDVKLINGTTNQYRLGDTFAGEWVEYTINVAQAGNYKVDFRVSQADPNAKVHAEVDGVHATSFTVPDTNNFSAFTTVSKTLGLTAGKHTFRLAFDQVASNGTVAGVDWIKFTQVGASTNIGTNTASYVRGGSFASQNFGNDQQILVKRSGNSAANTREGYLKFDLSSVGSIASAKLRLTARLSDNSNANVVTNVHYASNDAWTEGGLTWNNKPSAGSTVRGSVTVSGTTNATYEVDLTSLLQAEKAAGRNIVTLVLKNPNVTNAWTIFASDEAAGAPTLVIT